jgi:hypothetical protein
VARDTSDQAGGSQVSVLVTTTEVLAARPTRRRAIIRNNDATNPIYLNAGAAATTSHFIVKAGESVEIRTSAAVNGIATGGTVVTHVWDEFD